MRRVLIIGSAGAGKTTLACRIGTLFDLPVVHLDQHFWNPGWVETPRDEWERKVDRLVTGDRWVMDGNYGGTIDRRMQAADTVLFLDFPRRICITRVLRRWWSYRGRTRPDLPPDCPEKIDAEFLAWVWNYPRDSRPRILAALDRHRNGRRIEVLGHPREVETCLQQIGDQEQRRPDAHRHQQG